MVALGSRREVRPRGAGAPVRDRDGRAPVALRARLRGGLRAVSALLILPFLPDGGSRELYDRTLGYQASRSSPFSVWGLAPSLDFLRPVERAGAVVLALAVALWPRRKTPAQVAALAAAVVIAVQLGATHWFYFYVVWFLPLVLAALFVVAAGAGSADPRLEQPQGRRADHDLIARLQPSAGLAGGAHPRRRAGRDDVAGLEGHQRRQVGDELPAR